MNRQQATALVMYLNRCVSIVPTVPVEWDAIRSVLPTIEQVANGQLELVEKQPEVERSKPHAVS